MVLPHPGGPVNVNVRKAKASRPRAAPRHVGLASPMCVLCVHEHRARAGPPHTAASVAIGIAAHGLQARRVGPGTTRRANIVPVCPHCMHAQLTVPRAMCAHCVAQCTALSRHLSLSCVHTIGCAGGRSAIVEQASLFFGAASAASDLDVDRDLRIETRPAHLRTPSLPEVAL